MRYQPNRDYVSNDAVQTPVDLARRLITHFKPEGKILEPCRGNGNFFRLLPAGTEWCEITQGRDFFDWQTPVNWIITNPPWSLIRSFMGHAMKVSDNVVFLLTVNHVWTKARVRDIQEAGFGLKEIALVEMPPTFPQSGFQLGAVHVARGWSGPITLSDLSVKVRPKRSLEYVKKHVLPAAVPIAKRVPTNALAVA
jgi:hypothetical protein